MHRSIALLLLIPSLTHDTSAQRWGHSGLGMKLGGQLCNLIASDRTYLAVPGAVAGAYVPLLVSERLELQPELLISYQGSDLQHVERDATRLRMLYLQVPLSVKLFLTNAINLQAGLQAGRCLQAKADDTDVTADMRTYDVGFTAGLGVDLQRGVDITARYYGGTSPTLIATTGVNPRHRLIQLTAGLRIMRFNHRRARGGRG
jgi:hypothetical protein